MATSDHNVAETALDAAKCKLSAATQGYFRDDLLRLVVDKPSRRIPLIHRGYYLRHVAFAHHVDAFLNQYARTPVNVLSLGAGFDTRFFHVLQRPPSQRASARVVEVDCAPIAVAKAALLRQQADAFFPAGVADAGVEAQSDGPRGDGVTFTRAVGDASYALLACDLGDTAALARGLAALQIDAALPTLVIAECVVSYLEPERGTELLAWLARTFLTATAVLYDPISLDDAFGETLQRYFRAKGCELRALQAFRRPSDHVRRLLARAGWRACAIADMNDVYARLTTREDKTRLATLEPFDEHADWWLCNAHYAVIVASTALIARAAGLQPFLTTGSALLATSYKPRVDAAPVIVRTFELPDAARARELFASTHLAFASTSKAVRKFVENRLEPPDGDMFDVARNFRRVGCGFWVAEMDGEVVGCVGLKPAEREKGEKEEKEEPPRGVRAAELCRLSVDAPWRRRGVASALLATLEEFAIACGYTCVRLETIGAMDAAQRLYLARGYAETSTARFPSFSLVRFEKRLPQ